MGLSILTDGEEEKGGRISPNGQDAFGTNLKKSPGSARPWTVNVE